FMLMLIFFFFSSRRRHTRFSRDWSSDVCSSDLAWAAFAANNTRDNTRMRRMVGMRRLRSRSSQQASLAVTEGFEPSVRLYTVQRFSKPPPSATRPRHPVQRTPSIAQAGSPEQRLSRGLVHPRRRGRGGALGEAPGAG